MAQDAQPSSSPPSRNVYAFGATSFFNDTASEMAYWVLPAFLTSLGAGPDKLGLIEGVAESVASAMKLFSGYLADRVQRRKPLVVSGYVIASAVKPVLALATVWWHVLLIRFSDRLAKGIRGAPRDVMLAESVPKERVGSAFGLLQAMDSAGAIAGPLLAIWILRSHGLRDVFWAALVPGSLSILIAFVAIRETRRPLLAPRAQAAPVAVSKKTKSVALPTSFYYVLGVVTLFSLGNSSDMFLVLRAENVGIAPALAPLLGLAFNVTYTAFSWPAGALSDHLSRRTMAALGYLVFAAVYAIFAVAPSRAAIWAAMSFYGLFYALTNPVLRALVAEKAPPEIRGRAFGIYYFVTSVAALLSSVITGELWKQYGPRLPFMLSAGVAVVSALLLLASRWRQAEARVSGNSGS
jgi:MFS family permease